MGTKQTGAKRPGAKRPGARSTHTEQPKPGKDDQRTLAFWAADCAARVLPCFEKLHPRDKRPRQALEALRAWARGDLRVGPVRTAALAAHAAARDAFDPAARAAARAAGQAAGTAHVAAHARAAGTYAVKAAIATASAAAAARELDWQQRQLPKRLWSFAFPA